MSNVQALFIDPDGPYPGLLGAENCWDEKRDALTFAGSGPMLVHPPCGRWCAMARLNERRWGAKVGDDGGCFLFALRQVVALGGVLEHPKASLAFERFAIPAPKKTGWTQVAERAWVCEVWQSAYGHKCHKATWLLYIGDRPPFELDWRRDKSLATHQVGGGIHTGNRQLPRCPSNETHLSPPAFAEALVRLAQRSRDA